MHEELPKYAHKMYIPNIKTGFKLKKKMLRQIIQHLSSFHVITCNEKLHLNRNHAKANFLITVKKTNGAHI
jgi:hypothetical protein